MQISDGARAARIRVVWSIFLGECHMKVSIFGLGYVGAVSAGCLARSGHKIIGVDPVATKVDHINAGESPIIEDGIAELIADVVGAGQLQATQDAAGAVAETDVSIVCVGTPSSPNGKLDLSYLSGVSQDIGTALAEKDGDHLIIVRSTVLPGTVEGLVLPILETATGRKHGDRYRVVYNPEFLREGTSIRDFFAPPMTLIGTVDDEPVEAVQELYSEIDAPFNVVPARVAEMMKYTCNAFHALKVSFANEVGQLAKRLGADSHMVMDLLCQDTKLNISKAYMKPGFAFGGSCLPKDLRAVTYKAKELDLTLPLLSSVLPSNRTVVDEAVDIVKQAGGRRVALLGLSFKPGTDDLRESPLLTLAEELLGKGFDLKIFDPLVRLDNLVGANKTYLLREIPHISRLLAPTLEAVLDHGEVVVVGNAAPEFSVLENYDFRENQSIVDLSGLFKDRLTTVPYYGISW